MCTCHGSITTVGSVRYLAGRVARTGRIFAGKCLGNRPVARWRGRFEIDRFGEISFGCGQVLVLARAGVWLQASVLVVLIARILLS